MIGYVIMVVIGVPLVSLITAAMFAAPRNFRIPGLFLGSIILQIVGFIVAFAVIGVLLGFIVPQ